MSNETQGHAKAGLGKQAAVFLIGQLPYLGRVRRVFKACVISSESTSPSTFGGSLVFSKNLTATSPVTTPRRSVSACWNSCEYARFSSGVRCRMGESRQVSNRVSVVRRRAAHSYPRRYQPSCKAKQCAFSGLRGKSLSNFLHNPEEG